MVSNVNNLHPGSPALHCGYAAPGYKSKAPQVGEIAPDAKILSIDGGAPSTLLAEAKKLAAAKVRRRREVRVEHCSSCRPRVLKALDVFQLLESTVLSKPLLVSN